MWTAAVASRVVIYHSRARRQTAEHAERFVRRVLREIAFNARINASHGPYTTGRLARSIRAEGPRADFNIVKGTVGSELSYASAVEGGARPHLIFPIPPKTYMRFYWRKVGRTVYLDKVRHPGQRAKNYLSDAAQVAARRHNMIWYSREI